MRRLVGILVLLAGCAFEHEGLDLRPPVGPPGPPGPPPGRWQPKPKTSWQIQLTGYIDTTVDAAIYDLDVDTQQSVIDTIRAGGRKVICYFPTNVWESLRQDAAAFPPEVIGANVAGQGGEDKYLDIRHPAVLAAMTARLDRAVAHRCDAVNFALADSHLRQTGFPLAEADALAYARALAGAAHQRGLAVGQFGAHGLAVQLADLHDFVVAVDCVDQNECDTVAPPFLALGKPVFAVEYMRKDVEEICPDANAANLDAIIKRETLDLFRIACR